MPETSVSTIGYDPPTSFHHAPYLAIWMDKSWPKYRGGSSISSTSTSKAVEKVVVHGQGRVYQQLRILFFISLSFYQTENGRMLACSTISRCKDRAYPTLANMQEVEIRQKLMRGVLFFMYTSIST